jgi:hypothetical protein
VAATSPDDPLHDCENDAGAGKQGSGYIFGVAGLDPGLAASKEPEQLSACNGNPLCPSSFFPLFIKWDGSGNGARDDFANCPWLRIRD